MAATSTGSLLALPSVCAMFSAVDLISVLLCDGVPVFYCTEVGGEASSHEVNVPLAMGSVRPASTGCLLVLWRMRMCR